MAMKRNGKSPVSSDSDEKVMFFKDVSLGPHANSVALPSDSSISGGSEPDQEDAYWPLNAPHQRTASESELGLGTVIQGFIPPGRIKKYLPEMKQGSVNQLNNFYGSKNKPVYQVHSYEDFEANCDLKGDLYDVVGYMKLVNGHTLIERPILDEVEIATSRHIMVHVQSHDGPVMKLYLWYHAATDFYKKFNSYEKAPTVLLVTTVNTKRLREVVTKRETLTIADIFSYMKHESAKDAFFECTAMIDDVVHGSAWYYIACSGCHSTATKRATSLICTNTKCGKTNTAGVAQYRAKISVYENSDQAVFVLLGDAGRELIVSSYFEVTKHYNTRAITVTKVLSLDTPPPTEVSVENNIAATSEETTKSGNEVCGPSNGRGDSADGESKRISAGAETAKAKRPRC
ncbi:hypothetical protein HID58_057797 [Brassica napus]|uniref:Replication factor A C-terminal domain-containing protein n=1 Tax=Brassica napus TaxID=3708 RepID=A0ABQ7XFA7_BRANA|nr:hypothetical protein HID58_057797 [Brassica napus]